MEISLKTNKELYETLIIESEKECFNKALLEKATCPNCSSGEYVSHIIRGKPSSTACNIAPGCCMNGTEKTHYYCRRCEKEF